MKSLWFPRCQWLLSADGRHFLWKNALKARQFTVIRDFGSLFSEIRGRAPRVAAFSGLAPHYQADFE
jgi:hypothetical protein